MTKRSLLKEHLVILDEISSIMKAMQNSSTVELNKLYNLFDIQAELSKSVTEAGNDFFRHYPEYLEQMKNEKTIIFILIGSERGFCSGFNNNIINYINNMNKELIDINAKFIVIGKKLATKLENHPCFYRAITGANTLDEMQMIILQLLQCIEELSSESNLNHPQPWQWLIIYNSENNKNIQTNKRNPFIEFSSDQNETHNIPPLLNLSPNDFMLNFSDNYLYQLLYTTLYSSLISENIMRSHHISSALKKIDKQRSDLKKKLNLIRQEEITEEIELILLSAETIANEI